jgi:hypothetical protein
MQMLNFRSVALGMQLAVALSLCAACGGSSDNDDKGNNGNGGTNSMSSGGSSSGSGNKAGSSSGGNGSGGDFSTGVPGDKPIGELTDGEAEQLCADIADYVSTSTFAETQREFSCRLSGMLAALFTGAQTDAALQMACKATYDVCKAAPDETTSGECGKPDGSCTATVDELKACMADSVAAFEDLSEQIPSCAELTMESLAMTPTDMETAEPASCVALEMKCPDAPLPATDAP